MRQSLLDSNSDELDSASLRLNCPMDNLLLLLRLVLDPSSEVDLVGNAPVQ